METRKVQMHPEQQGIIFCVGPWKQAVNQAESLANT